MTSFGSIPERSSAGSPSQQQAGSGRPSSAFGFAYSSAPVSGRPSAAAFPNKYETLANLPFTNFYQRNPRPGEATYSMNEIARLATRRMEVLHAIQQKEQDQMGASFGDASLLHSDRTTKFTQDIIGFTSLESLVSAARPRNVPDVDLDDSSRIKPNMEDYVSHWACRLAFCQDPKWTEWFVKHEKIIFREKLRLVLADWNTFIGKNKNTNNNSAATSARSSGGGMIVGFGAGAGATSDDAASVGSPSSPPSSSSPSMTSASISKFLQLFPTMSVEPLTRDFFSTNEDDTEADIDFLIGTFFDFLCVSEQSYSKDMSHHERNQLRPIFIKNPNINDNLHVVPFKAVKDLVKRRKCFVHKGYAVVLTGHLIDFITLKFAEVIRRSTKQALLTRRSILEDIPISDHSTSPKATLLSLMDNVFKNIIVEPTIDLQAVVDNAGSIKFADMQNPAIAQQHMPPCMLMMDSTVRSERHLKHNGRWQFGLFLKAAGLPMLDNIKFFAEKMTQKGGGSFENFNKSAYGYGIRHMYGQEGKHTDYSSLSCPTMINGGRPNLAADKADCFGCPFKYMEDGQLRQSLGAKRVGRVQPTVGQIEEIVNRRNKNHYTGACRSYFSVIHSNVLHPDSDDHQLFNSPVDFFNKSRTLDQEAKEAEEGGGTKPGERRERGDGETKTEQKQNSSTTNPAAPPSASSPSAAPSGSGGTTRTLFMDTRKQQQQQ